ncbi:septum formation inhibitor Maf [Campylobacter sp. MIT 99-7217]|uniref:septum formation inhibitor Maf n=1 Tax=Campylobacter sp. MIT 99-7217 TaxID=535091 RepID=UPI00115C40BF|nr:septum formation inhibitor Maf [Campylobacter sp. MIT 99-7217]TQR33032.1 septum formation inhibitor Maf [Campylobacter sp. MIT 99-7217]
MLYLASSSSSRAKLLEKAHINFKQIELDYDESAVDINLEPQIYVQRVLLEKERQFYDKFNTFEEKVLFVDSIVSIQNKVFTKAKTKEEALYMLELQSGRSVCILSAMILSTKNFKLISLSKADLEFKPFDTEKMKAYIQNGNFKGKAGAVECEGFHKEYIKELKGDLSIALGLDIPTLKAYL